MLYLLIHLQYYNLGLFVVTVWVCCMSYISSLPCADRLICGW